MENHEQDEGMIEYMFEKALTPSDVGKLRRLVIPKKHAEKYFLPSRRDSVEKGSPLNFEDESGQLWTFHYLYWKSSQSYVFTRGWNRYVKEKQLDVGDMVSFQRRRSDGQQLYIRWQRRAAAAATPPPAYDSRSSHSLLAPSSTSSSSPVGSRAYHSVCSAYSSHQQHRSNHGPLYNEAVQPVAETPITQGRKQVVLFGVDLNCNLDETESPGPEVLCFSSQDPTHSLYPKGHGQNYGSWVLMD